MNSLQKEFICHIFLVNSILCIQNIEFLVIFSNEFILWIHNNEVKFMNSDWIQWILISEFIFLWIHTWIQNLYIIFVFICMNSYTHEFISLFHIWIHMYMNSYIISYMNSFYEFIWLWIHMIFSYMNSYVSWIHVWNLLYQGSRWCKIQPVLDVLVGKDIELLESDTRWITSRLCLSGFIPGIYWI